MSRPKSLGPLGRALAARLPSKARERLLGPPPWKRRNRLRVGVALGFYAVTMVGVVALLEPAPPSSPATVWLLAPGIVVLAFLFQTMDATTGMGFGTALSPLLLAAGYGPLDVVPSLLIAQAFTGLLSGWLHQELENVQFSFRRPFSNTAKALGIIAALGSVATVLAIWVTYIALEVPDWVIETYIALLVIIMGLSLLIRRMEPASGGFRQSRLVGFALLTVAMVRNRDAAWVPWVRALVVIHVMFGLYNTLGRVVFVAIPVRIHNQRECCPARAPVSAQPDAKR